MLTNLLVQAPYGDWPGPWHMMGWGGGFWWIFPFLMMLFVIGVCVFFLTRMPWGHAHGPASAALQILAERFAKGEISKEEYEEKRTLIGRRP